MEKTLPPSAEALRSLLEQVKDPEIPVLSVIDLGIIRDIRAEGRKVEVVITPTYTGCPAMDTIRTQIRMLLLQQGFTQIDIRETLSPPWTTDWMTAAGKEKLEAYGIAAPHPRPAVCDPAKVAAQQAIQCPHCGSWHTHRVSEFGSTACKALYQCDDCREPFDYFKCH